MKTLIIAVCAFIASAMFLPGCRPREAATDCEADLGACVKNLAGGITASFDIAPKPVRTMTGCLFTVTLKEGETPVAGATVTLELSMPGMLMAANRVELYDKGQGVYEGKGVIVRCTSGRRIWRAGIVIERPGRNTVSADFTFRVKK